MRDELHGYLDGELPAEELSAEARREAEAWDALLEDVRAAGPAGAPAGLGPAIVRAVLEGGRAPWWRRAVSWWVRPRSVRISPLAAGLAAAAAVALALALPLGGPGEPEDPRVAGGAGSEADPGAIVTGPAGVEERAPAAGGRLAEAGEEEPVPTQTVYVKFLLEAPAARSVSLAGNFNEWSPNIPLEDHDGDGVWSATVPMKPGVHEYMFVVDGSTWVTDPHANRYEEDGYGNQNAVLAIAGPRAGI